MMIDTYAKQSQSDTVSTSVDHFGICDLFVMYARKHFSHIKSTQRLLVLNEFMADMPHYQYNKHGESIAETGKLDIANYFYSFRNSGERLAWLLEYQKRL